MVRSYVDKHISQGSSHNQPTTNEFNIPLIYRVCELVLVNPKHVAIVLVKQNQREQKVTIGERKDQGRHPINDQRRQHCAVPMILNHEHVSTEARHTSGTSLITSDEAKTTEPLKGPRLRLAGGCDHVALRDRIDRGEWLPGEVLPSVAELAGAYEVSSSTAGRAIRVLVGEGKLTTVKGWGTFVAEKN